MPRVKRGTKRRQRRRKILKQAEGYFLTKSKLFQSCLGRKRPRRAAVALATALQ